LPMSPSPATCKFPLAKFTGSDSIVSVS